MTTKFKISRFTITQISYAGIWLVESKELYDVAMLFLRAQEFYESSNPNFYRKTFLFEDYMRWYSLEMSDDHSFTYAQDWEGFNVPQDIVEEYLNCPAKENLNSYDITFRNIVDEVKARQGGKYYLIGAAKGDSTTIDHEISHGFWNLVPEYKERAKTLLDDIPVKDLKKLRHAFNSMGYAKSVVEDEMVAYLSTGLTKKITHFDSLRWPFMENFYTMKSKLLEGTDE